MNSFSVIEVNDPQWADIVYRSLNYDFYHTQSYHLLEKENRPVLFLSKFNDDFIGLPLIIREIPNTNLYDCTSVYGYCGPISNLNFEKIPLERITYFKENIYKYFKENNIITVFSRLHPLRKVGGFFDGFGTVRDVNKTVAIDLMIPIEQQRNQYRKSTKSKLNQLRKRGFEVYEATEKVDIDLYIEMYHNTMESVNAADNYYFEADYFYKFLDSNCFQKKLLLARKDGQIIAGAIFTITNKVMQYHVSASTKLYIKDTPMKLILDHARLIANELKLEFLHLGGGVGGSDSDSLFFFKSGFSNYRGLYQTWQMIVDDEKYNELVINGKSKRESSFFPLYRSPNI
jgi:hypothetical protein